MSRQLTGKVALVTGGSRGIGAEVARRLAAEGADLVIACRSDRAAADRVAADLIAAGARVHVLTGDVANPADCAALVAGCVAQFGRLDILVNCAGVAKYLPLDQAGAAHFHAMFDTNVLGTLSLTRAAAEVMGQGGRIIHFSSRDRKSVV